jgi:hypothetical protein
MRRWHPANAALPSTSKFGRSSVHHFGNVQTVEPGRLLAIDRCCRHDQVAGGVKVKCGEGQASGPCGPYGVQEPWLDGAGAAAFFHNSAARVAVRRFHPSLRGK